MKSQKAKAISSVVAGFILFFYLGAFNITGNISPYIQSYYNTLDQNVTDGKIYILLPGILIVFVILFPIAAYYSKTVDPRLMVFIGCSIGVASTFAAAFCTNYWAFFVLYSVGYGIAQGVVYPIPLYNSWKHYPDHKGLISGIVMCGIGLGSFTFSLYSVSLVNPDGLNAVNGQYPKEVSDRVPYMLKILSLVWAILCIIGFIFTFPPPPPSNLPQHSELGNESKRHSSGLTHDHLENTIDISADKSNEDIKSPLYNQKQINTSDIATQLASPDTQEKKKRSLLVQCLLSKQFIVLYIVNFMSIFVCFFISGTYKLYGKEVLNDDSYITIVGALSGIFGGIRFVWAPICDKLTYKVLFSIIIALNTVIGFTFIYIVQYKALFMIYVCIAFWFAGGQFAIYPIVITRNFGSQAVMVYSFGLSFCGFTQLISSLLINLLLDKLGYLFFYFLGGGLNALSLVLLIVFFKDEKFCS